jgi:hypothetical protein
MHEFDLNSKVNLLRVCIRSDLSYINEYEFKSYEIQSWLELIKMLRFVFTKNNKIFSQNLIEKFIHYLSLLFRIIFSNKERIFLVMQGN